MQIVNQTAFIVSQSKHSDEITIFIRVVEHSCLRIKIPC